MTQTNTPTRPGKKLDMAEENTPTDWAYRIQHLKCQLRDTDYISSKMADNLMSCSSSEEVDKVLADFNSQYSDILTQRQQWRDEINELEAQLASVTDE